MAKKIDIRKRIKLLSWTSLIGLFIVMMIAIYNVVEYIHNLQKVKVIVQLINQNTSIELKSQIIKTLSQNIHNSEILLLFFIFLSILLISLVVYLGVSIKKETNKRIHAMDWIME